MLMPLHAARTKTPARQTAATILHFDYDCFYASVFEHESPHLRALPLAVQQKQIVVTCNYEARRRGLYKLQLITEAKRTCPDLVIVLGEDLTPFRNASKELYAFFTSFSWNARCERLGFDEVFMDVSDLVEYNANTLSSSNLRNSFFCLSRADPTVGFSFDASNIAGHSFPPSTMHTLDPVSTDPLKVRLLLASHLAQHLREQLESKKGYTATAGISTNKTLAKLVGSQHKPNSQTTLLPPYTRNDGSRDNVSLFMVDHEIGKIPGIGFKISQKLRAHVLGRLADFDTGLVYGGTKENVSVRDVLDYPHMGPEALERLLGGSGAPHGIGARVWHLLNGCDDAGVGQARQVPTQISIEDSYVRLVTFGEVAKELHSLATSLLRRMHTDLLEDREDEMEDPGHTQVPIMSNVPSPKRYEAAKPIHGVIELAASPPEDLPPPILAGASASTSKAEVQARNAPSFKIVQAAQQPYLAPFSSFNLNCQELAANSGEVRTSDASGAGNITRSVSTRRWLAHPKTIRLSTRPRPPQNPDGSRNRSFARISRSAPMPNFVFSLKDDIEMTVERLVGETLLPLFHRLHPEKSGWNLSLVNIAAANMADSARDKGGVGRDIAKMFRQQDDVLKQWRVEETGEGMVGIDEELHHIQPRRVLQTSDSRSGSEDVFTSSQQADASADYAWDYVDEEMDDADFYKCEYCGAMMPWFAMGAHERFHANKRS